MNRWGHFILFTFAIIEGIANRPSEIPDAKDSDAESKLQDSHASLKVLHRDGSWKLFSRILSTLSVFIYQGTVFYAQMVLATEMINCDSTGACHYVPIRGNTQVWLILETLCFYSYLFATVVYIAWRMLSGVCSKAG